MHVCMYVCLCSFRIIFGRLAIVQAVVRAIIVTPTAATQMPWLIYTSTIFD